MESADTSIELYLIESNAATNELKRKLADFGVRVVERGCPRSAAEWLQFPFVRESSGSSYYGELGISFYLSKLASKWREQGRSSGRPHAPTAL